MALNDKYTLILGSQSPRRKELLGWMDVPFNIVTSDIHEHSDAMDPIEFAKDIAAQKGRDVWQKLEDVESLNPLLVASDTVVECEGRKYGKPSTVEEAREMLLSLSGRTHHVVTAVYLKAFIEGREREYLFSVSTDVTFNKIAEDILVPYLNSRESMDKAGAYGIQEKGLTFVKSISGSYSNVVGFPLVEFIEELKSFLSIPANDVDWRRIFKC